MFNMIRNALFLNLKNVNIYKMSSFKNSFINECIKILKKKEVKDELKALMRPMIDMIMIEVYPYILLSLLFVIISFLLILGIFVLLLRNNRSNRKLPQFLNFSSHSI